MGDFETELTEQSEQKAREELNEIPSDRISAVQTFRQWILAQDYIKCPTDTRFLLAFLRTKKFSQLESRKLLENFITMRNRLPNMFQDLDPTDPDIQMCLDKGYVLVLPKRDREGRRVMLARQGQMDPEFLKNNKLAFYRTLATVQDFLYFDENIQVNGTASIMDMTGYGMAQHTAFTMSEQKDFNNVIQRGYPCKIKGIHLYNMGAFLEFMTGVIKIVMTEKMQKRIKTHSDLESVYKHIPMDLLPDEYLPDDYKGPSAGSIDQVLKQMKDAMTRREAVTWIKTISSSSNVVNLSQKPQFVPQISYRKLSVD